MKTLMQPASVSLCLWLRSATWYRALDPRETHSHCQLYRRNRVRYTWRAWWWLMTREFNAFGDNLWVFHVDWLDNFVLSILSNKTSCGKQLRCSELPTERRCLYICAHFPAPLSYLPPCGWRENGKNNPHSSPRRPEVVDLAIYGTFVITLCMQAHSYSQV